MMVGVPVATGHLPARFLCLGAVLATGLAIAGACLLAALNRYDPNQLLHLLPTFVATLVGGLIAARRPANPVGWLILVHALCFSVGEFSRQYALYGDITRPGAFPLATAVASPAYWIWMPGIACGFLLWPLVFPNGRLIGPRWRVAVWYVIGVTMVATLLQAVQPGDYETPGISNPLGMPALSEWDNVVDPVSQVLWISSAIVAVVSLIARYRRANEIERRQIRWPAYAVGLALAGILVDRLLPIALPDPVLLLTLGGIWCAIGIAILRYHLFDIDLIIRRTLVYAVVTAVLAALYVGGVVLVQRVLRAVTGQEADLAIVASTLAVVVCFQPLRQRVQRFIDRQFYRQKYDAARILANHGAVVRDEVDIDRLTVALVHAANETLRPARASLWLRTPEERR